ncbi:small-subunit processome [Jimgerdemannia flammicorona]|uniref:Small-subunit processome n=1 Tax=Jimgerdemannia flammicorona TaxID=994334 RepID=A0A433QD15_9FUNG|nr:small-subunit processome [Jimgerdemannia flammicorona]
MSSIRNAVHRRNHKERSQLAHRQRYGLLEKHKDYVLRAKDYHFKQDRLKALRERAQFKNPDEFYFKMISTKTKDGLHIAERNNQLSGDMVQLLKSQDLNYIKTQRDVSKKKIDKLQDSLQFLEADDGEDDEDAEMDEQESSSATSAKKSTHIVFVDNEEQAKNFDPVKHLDTLPELVNRKFNRPRIETLKQHAVAAPLETELKVFR